MKLSDGTWGIQMINKKPIRVLHFFGIMNRGGAETFIMNVYRQISKDDIQFDFVVHTMEEGDYDSEILKLGGKIYKIPRFNGLNYNKYIKSLEKLFDNYSSKIIHCHIRSTASIILKVAKQYNYKTIAHSHSVSSGRGVKSLIKNFLQRKITKYSDINVACSQSAGEWLFKKSEFFILKNGIDLNKFGLNTDKRTILKKEMKLENSIVLGHVGRFSEVKNHEFLIDVFNEFYKLNKDAKLVLIGEGHLLVNMKKKANKMGLTDKIYFLGLKENIEDYLQIMDIFIFPSLYEGLGISVIEAQVSNIPTICSEKIPNEANITDLFYNLPLKENKDEWSKKIFEIHLKNKKNRLIMSEENIASIEKSGYNILESICFLENLYNKL